MASWKTQTFEFIECLIKLLKAIYIVVEKVLKAFLKAIMTYYQMTNSNDHASDYGVSFSCHAVTK